jgi:hypothetical protein
MVLPQLICVTPGDEGHLRGCVDIINKLDLVPVLYDKVPHVGCLNLGVGVGAMVIAWAGIIAGVDSAKLKVPISIRVGAHAVAPIVGGPIKMS